MGSNPKTVNGVEQHEPLQSSVQLQCNLGRPKSKSSSVKSPNVSTQPETKTDDSVKKRGKFGFWFLCSEVKNSWGLQEKTSEFTKVKKRCVGKYKQNYLKNELIYALFNILNWVIWINNPFLILIWFGGCISANMFRNWRALGRDYEKLGFMDFSRIPTSF